MEIPELNENKHIQLMEDDEDDFLILREVMAEIGQVKSFTVTVTGASLSANRNFFP